MNTEENQYGVNASLPRKIFSQAKNLNLKWNFSLDGEIIFPEIVGSEEYLGKKIEVNIATAKDFTDNIEESVAYMGATEELLIRFDNGSRIFYMPYEFDTEITDHSTGPNSKWIEELY